jgi:hypothetical protein
MFLKAATYYFKEKK